MIFRSVISASSCNENQKDEVIDLILNMLNLKIVKEEHVDHGCKTIVEMQLIPVDEKIVERED